LAWVSNEDYRGSGRSVILLPISPPPHLSTVEQLLHFVIEGSSDENPNELAAFLDATRTPIDVEQIMRKLADNYADSFKHLVALYAVTTQVTRKDAAVLTGVIPWNWHKTYEEPMLQEVRYEFAVESPNNGQFSSPYQAWREQYEQSDTSPAEALLEQYSHTVCIAGALPAQIHGKTYRQAALDIGRNPNTFPKYMKRAARMLSAAYA